MTPRIPQDSVIDILVVCGSGTLGWQTAARQLTASFARAGARVQLAQAAAPPQVRTFMATDLVQASAARKTTLLATAEYRPEAVVYCSVTAALLAPRRGAIWLDATAAENRPGRHGIWQRPMERLRLARAPLLLTQSPRALDGFGGRSHAEAINVPVVVEPSGPPASARDIDAIAYAADPVKRQLDVVLDAWRQARRGDETLVVTGVQRADQPGVRFVGRLDCEQYRAMLRRARVFVAARREDFGIGALEALADGVMVVTTPAPGPYPARDLAAELDPRLVSDDLGAAVRAALDTPVAGYAARAATLMAPYRAAAVDVTVRERVLPHLLPGWRT